jgi:ectoine hydroxylase-related dioxygenase (phytanoyl-CoA dioxygenase family)
MLWRFMVLLLLSRPFVARAFSIRSSTSVRQTKLFQQFQGITQQTMSTMPARDGMFPATMTDDERYLFDLNGYLIVRNVLTSEEVAAANAAIDSHAEDFVARDDDGLRNAIPGTKMYGSGPSRQDLGQVLEWGIDDSRVFRTILAHPRLVPVFHGILGKGYRLDHLPFVISQDHGAEGFRLHGGTIDCETGEYNHNLAYHCQHDTIRCHLLGCNVILTDHNPGDGGFCIVPGSHKSNFKMPSGMVDGECYSEYIQQPATKAGDVILFSEGTVHGALPWTPPNRPRRVCLYRFAPATHAYGRSYHPQWPEKMYEHLTKAELAVLEPPYANRLDRPNIQEDGSIVITTRSARKKKHDRDVFGTNYF